MDQPTEVAGRSSQHDPLVVDGQPPTPPEAPIQDKRWLFYRYQLVGIPLMFLIVVAATLGVFGKSQSTVTGNHELAEVTIDHVSRFRFKMIGPLDLTVENTSSQPLPAVRVRIDRDYLEQFSTVTFTPEPTFLTREWAVFDLGDLAAGDSTVIAGEIQAESFGRHTGEVEVTADGMEPVVKTISTLSLP